MLTVLGASHHDLELPQLERLAAGGELLAARLADLVTVPDGPLSGVVLLATCNRLEIYADAVRFHDAIDAVTDAVAQATGIPDAEASALLHVRVGAPVAAHLFGVTAGLDSMVVGEAEIAGQVSRAFRAAQTAGTTSPALHQLFQGAARASKRVATVTGLGAAGRSVASVALDLAVGSGDPLAGARTLIIGTGAYARVVAAEIRARGGREVFVHSPSGRAAAFAHRHDATPVDADGLADAMALADLVVTCSGAGDPVVDELMVRRVVARRDRPLPIVDLALRSDLTPQARQVPGVRVVDLHSVAGQADSPHIGAITAAQDIVIAAVADYEDQLAQRRLDPAVVALRQHVSGTVAKELERLRAKYPADIAADVERAMHRVTQSLLHTPTMRAKELALSGDSAGYLSALHTLFGIDIEHGVAGQHPSGPVVAQATRPA